MEHVPVSSGVLDASFITVQRREDPGNKVHIAGLLGEPPPILVVPSPVVVSNGAEIEGPRVEHIAVSIND